MKIITLGTYNLPLRSINCIFVFINPLSRHLFFFGEKRSMENGSKRWVWFGFSFSNTFNFSVKSVHFYKATYHTILDKIIQTQRSPRNSFTFSFSFYYSNYLSSSDLRKFVNFLAFTRHRIILSDSLTNSIHATREQFRIGARRRTWLYFLKNIFSIGIDNSRSDFKVQRFVIILQKKYL